VKLPGAEQAVIDPTKIHGYLLSPEHPVGRFKARFFRSLGYSNENWQRLETDFRNLVTTQDATAGQTSTFGQKYEVCGILEGPDKTAAVTTVWIVRPGEGTPRFITAYPGGDE